MITDLQSLRIQNAALQAAIAEAIKPFGLTLERQAGSINDRDGTLKLTLSTTFLPAGVEDKETLERTTWAKWASMFGLPADSYGKTVQLGGKDFALVSFNLNRSKNNVNVRRIEDGKMFLTTADNVKRILARQPV